MLPWVVRELTTNAIIEARATTSFRRSRRRDRTRYAGMATQSRQRRASRCSPTPETLGAVVGFRTDNYNLTSQRAIAALGAHLDGVLPPPGPARWHRPQLMMYSIVVDEWSRCRTRPFAIRKRSVKRPS